MKTIFQNLKEPYLKIVMVPRRTVLTSDGATIANTNNKTLEFHPQPETGYYGGLYITDDEKEIKFIRQRMKLNGRIKEISVEEQQALKERQEEEKEVREEIKKRRAIKKKK